MEFKYAANENVVNVVLKGELDTPATIEIQPKIDEILAHADKLISFDCKDLSYIASSGLRQFISIYKRCGVEGGHLELRNINPDVLEIFKVTNFDKVFDIK